MSCLLENTYKRRKSSKFPSTEDITRNLPLEFDRFLVQKTSMDSSTRHVLLDEIGVDKKNIDIVHNSIGSYNTWRRLQSQLQRKQKRLHDIETGGEIHIMRRRFQRLQKLSHTFSRITVDRIMNASPSKFLLDTDQCLQCRRILVFNNVTFDAICTYCGTCSYILFAVEDMSIDSIIHKASAISGTSVVHLPISSAVDTVRPPLKTTATMTMTTDTKAHYSRDAGYSKFVMQFAHDALPIPHELIRYIYTVFQNVHLTTSNRCRPTPIANSLRNHPTLSMFMNHALRIAWTFNGDRVPSFSPTLSKKLLWRYSRVMSSLTTLNKQRLFSFELLTRVFLQMENETEMANMFPMHKTRSVMIPVDGQLNVIMRVLHDTDPMAGWDRYRRCI